MGNRIAISTIIGSLLFAALAVVLLQPSRADAGITAKLVKRLCDRQEKLGDRLRHPFIDPDICNPPTPVEPTLEFSADPTTIQEGDSSTLEWSSVNATSCIASGGWSGAKSLSGTQIVSPPSDTTYTLVCTGSGGSVTESVTVFVVDAPEAPTLTLVKTVINDNGGTTTASSFQARIDGTNVPWSSAQTVGIGAHTASEVTLTGYTAGSWGGDCAANGTVTLAAGEDKTCTITNNDQQGTLIVKKVVVRDNGGTAATSTFSFQIDGGGAIAFEADGQNDVAVDAGTHSTAEPAVAGYSTTYDNCSNVFVANGETETCTITNNDVPPQAATLTLIKEVVNDDGGTTTAAHWTLAADGPTDISGVSGSASVTNAVVTPGFYELSESGGPSGYSASVYVCSKNEGPDVESNSITLDDGDDVVCTITNGDEPGTLIVKKWVIRDNGGDAATTTFSFQIDGGTVTAFEADGQNDVAVNAGMHTVTEPAVAGYTTTYENCADVFIPNGGTATCTVTNDDVAQIPPLDHLLISEVYYDVASTTPGTNTHNEWLEIFNPTASDIDISGWEIADGTSADVIPASSIVGAGEYLLIAATTTLRDKWTIPAEVPIVFVGLTIGNGLADGGDVVTLTNLVDVIVDAVSWGSNTAAFNPSVSLVADGNSIARSNLLVDNNTAADWVGDATPSPGQ